MTTHETFVEHSGIKTSSDRAFGLTVGGILAAIGGARLLLGDHLASDFWTIAMLAIGSCLVVIALIRAATLAALNRAWTKLGLLMFKVISPVVLFLIFALSVVPTAIIMRALGQDPLRLHRDGQAPTYWINRMPPGPAPEGMQNQF